MFLNWVFALLFQLYTIRPTAELQGILNKVFTHEGMSYYLDRPPASKEKFLFRFDTSPLYNGSIVENKKFNVPYRKNILVKYNIKPGNDENRLVIIIEAIAIKGDTATVKLWIPYNAVAGKFTLFKSRGLWVVTQADVEQI